MVGKTTQVKSITEVSVHPADSFPSKYAFFGDSLESKADPSFDANVPIIDFSLLESDNPHERRQVIENLGHACETWGFFLVVNHGVPECLMKAVIDKCEEFFKLSAEEKQEFEGGNVFDPIRCGTSYNTAVEEVSFWRDFLKVMVHPKFHCPANPIGFCETLSDYSKHVRRIARGLLGGISTSLGLHEQDIEKSMDFETSGQQVVVANYYPPCPRPDLAIGLPPHSDHGLLTLLNHNQVGGLQIFRDDKWVPITSASSAFIVNVADQLEIISNGKYKSILHRAMVNNLKTRVSIAILNGPSFDTFVRPEPKLINGDDALAKYKSLSYRKYFALQQTNRLVGKSGLDIVRVQTDEEKELR